MSASAPLHPITAEQFETVLFDIAWLAKRIDASGLRMDMDPGAPAGHALTVSEVQTLRRLARFADAIRARGLVPGVAAPSAEGLLAIRELEERNARKRAVPREMRRAAA